MFLEKDVLESVSSVRSAFPSSLGLISAVLEDDRIFIGINRNLVEDVGVVAVSLLSFRTQKMFRVSELRNHRLQNSLVFQVQAVQR
jgi:hypothetical protein